MKEHRRADSVNLNTTEAGLSQGQPFDLFRDTIWPSWLRAKKDAGGAGMCQLTFSCRSFSLISQCETKLYGEYLKKEMDFHGWLKVVIKHAPLCEIIQLSDTIIVFCLICGSAFFCHPLKCHNFIHVILFCDAKYLNECGCLSSMTNKSHYHFYIMTTLIALITALSWLWSVILVFTATIAANSNCQRKTIFMLTLKW